MNICMRFLMCPFFTWSLLFLTSSMSAQNDSVQTGFLNKGVALAERVLDLLSYETPRISLAVYPNVGYSERTGLEVGVTPVLRFISSQQQKHEYYRPSTLTPTFLVSSRGMYEVELDVNLFTRDDWCINAKTQFLYLPDKFYGLGNADKDGESASFDSYKYSLSGEVMKGVSNRLFVGLQLDVNYHQFEDIDNPSDNALSQLDESIEGFAGGWSNGIGPVVSYDSRNSVVYPSGGWYALASHLTYGAFAASDYRFGTTTLDVRRYFALHGNDQVVALQGYFNSVYGDVPFYKLSTVGGKRLLRGIGHPYKYMGSHAWLAQAEYRRYIWWRLGAVAFAGIGNVFNRFDSAALDKMHVMTGAGLRFRALAKESLNIRLDYGITNRGDHALFIAIREGF